MHCTHQSISLGKKLTMLNETVLFSNYAILGLCVYCLDAVMTTETLRGEPVTEQNVLGAIKAYLVGASDHDGGI
jgi:hypothetical protein